MSFLLDTCTISAHIRRPAGLQARFVQYSGRLYLSTVTLAELYVLAYRLDDPTARLKAIEEVIRDELGVNNSGPTRPIGERRPSPPELQTVRPF
jgi:predicted nucleic acid-binding protein